MPRSTLAALTILAMLLASILVTPTSTLAATYDGSDPNTTGCASTARTIYSLDLSGRALVELRYSTACRTTWARVTKYSSDSSNCTIGATGMQFNCVSARITRKSDNQTYPCSTRANERSCYTKQVNDAGVTSFARGCYIFTPSNTYCRNTPSY